MQLINKKNFYQNALKRLLPEEYKRERSRNIPYAFSLSILCSFFWETGIRQGWFSLINNELLHNKPIILAVSGGSDSTALLWFFKTFCGDRQLIAAHFEHGIRGEESKEDSLFIEKIAKQWEIETVICHENVPDLLKKGESLETGARRLRYDFFEQLALKYGAWGVALGHNKEDAAETTLFNLLRGSGVRGLAGIPEQRGIFFRPLLQCSHDFLRDILKYRGITWREDSTNKNINFTRNFIRNKLMPFIKENVNSKVIDHLVAFAEEMRYYREEEELQGDKLIEINKITDIIKTKNMYIWNFGRAKISLLTTREKIVLIREVGRRFKIPVLSRKRCMELAFLIEGGKKFEFQWGSGTYILGDRDKIKWLTIS